jgi:hypothetical protein
MEPGGNLSAGLFFALTKHQSNDGETGKNYSRDLSLFRELCTASRKLHLSSDYLGIFEMRGITTIVFLMFISGYYLHLDTRGRVNHSAISYQKAENNLFTEMLTRLPYQNETGDKDVFVTAASARDNCGAWKACPRISLLTDGNYSPLDDIGIKPTAFLRSL